MLSRGLLALGLIISASAPVNSVMAGEAELSRAELIQIYPDLVAEHHGDTPYSALVARVARHLELDAGLIDAVIARESNYRVDAVSSDGAIGLMQLMPGGGAIDAYELLYGRPGKPTKASLAQADVNVWLGSAYLRLLEDRYYADYLPDARVPLMLAAYNWGIGHMLRKPPDRKLITTRTQALAWIDKRCPPETRVYVRRVLSKYDSGKNAYQLYGTQLAANIRPRLN